MPSSTSFDASASAVGYIYQVRYALLLALDKLDIADDPDDCAVSIEKVDDISFHESGLPIELLQSKYHANPGNLSDRSSDIWKTIRVWAEFLSNNPDIEDVTFTLITTESPAANSLAQLLSPTKSLRNETQALLRMMAIANEEGSDANRPGYAAFSGLSSLLQQKLVRSMYVLTGAELIDDVLTELRKRLRKTVDAARIDAFLTRLEGAWFQRAVSLLKNTQFTAIPLSELVSIIDDLRVQFLPQNLTTDYDEVIPDVIDIDGDQRIFVEQLRLIGANDRAIRWAIINYYRACEQRSRWSRDNLLKPGEVHRYLSRLHEEWEHYLSMHELTHSQGSDDDARELGRAVYASCQSDGAIPIRQLFEAKYVARGSYHDLADKQKIGWHPNYQDELTDLDQGAA